MFTFFLYVLEQYFRPFSLEVLLLLWSFAAQHADALHPHEGGLQRTLQLLSQLDIVFLYFYMQ
jgi:hypothetical protein